MTNFRSLAGGFFSSSPHDKATGPVTIRCNNPGAINGASWERTFPGYVEEFETTPGNKSTVFETPEQGAGAWWELMRRYRVAGALTVGDIIKRYGGGQDYSAYATQVATWTKLPVTQEIKLYGDDATLLTFAKAMFRYEAGKAIPWSDQQIMFGIELARNLASGTPTQSPPPPPTQSPIPPPTQSPPPPPAAPALPWLIRLLYALFGPPKKPGLMGDPVLVKGMPTNDEVRKLQTRLIELGFRDLVIDGDFGETTEKAVRTFQTSHNLDPDGEVGINTAIALNRADAAVAPQPLSPPPAKAGPWPPWYEEAAKWIGFHEVGDNHGIEKFIAGAHVGQLGNPYCAIFINFTLETHGIPGSRSAMARDFEHKPTLFIKLDKPCLGCIVTMWRISKTNGSGHVFLYDGENTTGIRGIGANEDDRVKRSFHDRARVTGYWWPASVPVPKLGPIAVADVNTPVTAGKEV